jgi:hypothetical protein
VRRAFVVFWAALLLVALAAPPVLADEIAARRLRFAERGKRLVVWGTFTDLFDAELLEKLDSGFTTTIVLRAYVYAADDATVPIAVAAATYRVVYDLWEEIYEIQVRDGDGERNFTRRTQAEALKAVTTMDGLAVAALTQVTIEEIYFLGVIVEANPVSEELLAEVRRWLAKSGGKGVTGSSSFFGSFVSVFVNPKVPEADRVLMFKSQPFYRPKRKS